MGSEQDEPITVVTALMLNMDSQWHPVSESIQRALEAAFGREDFSNYEIRGSALYRKIRKGDTTAQKLMLTLMGIPHQHLVPVFYGAVDRAGFRAFVRDLYEPSVIGRGSYPPDQDKRLLTPLDTFKEALNGCIETVDSYVHTAFPSEQVLWIHDRGRYDEDAKGKLKELRWVRSTFGDFMKLLHPGIYADESHVADTIYFGNSEESRALQLADVCCATITRQLRGDPVASPYYRVLQRQVATDGARPKFENAEQLIKRMKLPWLHKTGK